MTIKRVGLIGVGLMGHGIGKNILEKGYQLTVMAHRNRAPVDDLVAKGAHERNNPLARREGVATSSSSASPARRRSNRSSMANMASWARCARGW